MYIYTMGNYPKQTEQINTYRTWTITAEVFPEACTYVRRVWKLPYCWFGDISIRTWPRILHNPRHDFQWKWSNVNEAFYDPPYVTHRRGSTPQVGHRIYIFCDAWGCRFSCLTSFKTRQGKVTPDTQRLHIGCSQSFGNEVWRRRKAKSNDVQRTDTWSKVLIYYFNKLQPTALITDLSSSKWLFFRHYI